MTTRSSLKMVRFAWFASRSPRRSAQPQQPGPLPWLRLSAGLPGFPGFYIGLRCDAGVQVTCRKCKVPMKEIKGHIYHQQRVEMSEVRQGQDAEAKGEVRFVI